jgi:hypothetical protein
MYYIVSFLCFNNLVYDRWDFKALEVNYCRGHIIDQLLKFLTVIIRNTNIDISMYFYFFTSAHYIDQILHIYKNINKKMSENESIRILNCSRQKTFDMNFVNYLCINNNVIDALFRCKFHHALMLYVIDTVPDLIKPKNITLHVIKSTELCDKLIEKNINMTEETLEMACLTQNLKLMTYILNNRIVPTSKCLTNVIYHY